VQQIFVHFSKQHLWTDCLCHQYHIFLQQKQLLFSMDGTVKFLSSPRGLFCLFSWSVASQTFQMFSLWSSVKKYLSLWLLLSFSYLKKKWLVHLKTEHTYTLRSRIDTYTLSLQLYESKSCILKLRLHWGLANIPAVIKQEQVYRPPVLYKSNTTTPTHA